MPKLLVLFDARSDDMTRLAEAVAEGALRVRFAEVDVRRLGGAAADGTPSVRHRGLESAEALAAYDGIIIGAVPAGMESDPAMAPIRAATTSLVNKVGSAFAATEDGGSRSAALWSVLTPMADRGMILVAPPISESPSDELESAREQGKRVADVVGWVTHARSHHHHH
jgi:NAD(P)H dehydrogenase (quinone)